LYFHVGICWYGQILEDLRLAQTLALRIDPSEIVIEQFVQRDVILGRRIRPFAKELDQSVIRFQNGLAVVWPNVASAGPSDAQAGTGYNADDRQTSSATHASLLRMPQWKPR
jgi:hypothetical protein